MCILYDLLLLGTLRMSAGMVCMGSFCSRGDMLLASSNSEYCLHFFGYGYRDRLSICVSPNFYDYERQDELESETICDPCPWYWRLVSSTLLIYLSQRLNLLIITSEPVLQLSSEYIIL